MSEALARIEDVRNDMTLSQVGKLFAQSGFFSDAKQEAQAITKIMAGRENGFGAFSSMSGIHIIKGKMEMGADLLATAVKRSGKYNYKVVTMSPEECTVEFFEKSEFTGGKWEKVGVSSFTIEDARKAGLTSNDTYKKFARNMLFARAMSNGQAWYCPDVFQSRVYSEGEISGYSEPEPSASNIQQTEPSPQQRTKAQQIESLYSAIDTLTEDRHYKHIEASLSKWLNVTDLRSVTDVKKLYDYFCHVRDEMAKEIKVESLRANFITNCDAKDFDNAMVFYRKAKEAENAIPEKELAGMRETVTEYRSDLLEAFDESVIAKEWDFCQSIFDEAIGSTPIE